MSEHPNPHTAPIRVGVVADQTGPLEPAGLADANVARMVVGDINAKGGLLGRKLELYIEDGATDDAVASAAAEKLVTQHQVDVILGGILSSTRQAIKQPAVTEGQTLYIYPEQYEGQESDPLIFCTGPVPAQQVDTLVPWLMKRTGAKTFYLPSADYVWPHVMNARVREVVTANGGSILGEEYFPLDHADYRATVERIVASGADVVFNMTVPPGFVPFFEQLHESGYRRSRGTADLHLLRREHAEHRATRSRRGHVQLPRLLPGCRRPVQPAADGAVRRALPGSPKFTSGFGCSGLYRGLRLWASAVEEAGTLDQADVIAALDHAHIAEGPGGPATVVPGQHHVSMNMYIAQVRDGQLPGRRGARRDRSPGAPGRSTLRSPTEHPHQPHTDERTHHVACNHTGRRLRPFPRRVLKRRRGQAPRARVQGRDRLPRSRPRPTVSGSYSTGTPTAGRASCPTPMSRRS